MIKKTVAALFALALVPAVFAAPASAAAGIKIGILKCRIDGGWGYVLGSSKTLRCSFKPRHGRRPERYSGSITKLGADIGKTTGSYVLWAVFAPGSIGHGALEGRYFGATGEATLGVGAGANVLLGGLHRTITLQPVSLQLQTGLNVAGGIAALTLNVE